MSCNRNLVMLKEPQPHRYIAALKLPVLAGGGGGGGATNAKNLAYTSATAISEKVKNAEEAFDKLFDESVRYTAQSKSQEEQQQARTNIGAASGVDVEYMKEAINGNIESINRNTDNIYNLQQNKVEKEVGKGLSTNDYTTEEKNKLAGLENYNDTQIKADIANKEDKIEVVQNAPTTITIEPNKFYHWNGVTSLDITLGATTSNTDVFIIEFSSTDVPTNFVLHGAKWNDYMDIQPNSTYEVVIINGLATWGGWANE